MKITLVHKGNFNHMEQFLSFGKRFKPIVKAILNRYGQKGLRALQEATPKDTGKTSESWSYKIEDDHGNYKIVWYNSNVVDGQIIAVLLQYGHGTRNGGYVEGTDYINPAIASIFKGIAEEAWKEVRRA